MSFYSPLPKPPAGPSSPDAPARVVKCDLPACLDVLSGEVELIETWLGGLVADLIGGSGTADSANEQTEEMK